MKVTASVAFLCFLFIIGLRAEDQPHAFSGTWILDAEKSELVPLLDISAPVVGAENSGSGISTKSDYESRGLRPEFVKCICIPRLDIEEVGGEEWKLSGVTTIMVAIGSEKTSRGVPFIEMLKFDGKEHEQIVSVWDYPDMIKKSTKATLKKNKLQMDQVLYYPHNTVRLKNALTLSQDGKTLTYRTETQTLRPGLYSSKYVLEAQKQVFHRQ